MKHILFYIVIALLFFGCTHPKPKADEIVGVWSSADGAKIKFKSNNEADVINFPLDIENVENGVINGSAKWVIEKRKNITPFWGIDILINNSSLSEPKTTRDFLLISRSGLGGSGSKVTSLFIWKGDPDLDDRYEFFKKED